MRSFHFVADFCIEMNVSENALFVRHRSFQGVQVCDYKTTTTNSAISVHSGADAGADAADQLASKESYICDGLMEEDDNDQVYKLQRRRRREQINSNYLSGMFSLCKRLSEIISTLYDSLVGGRDPLQLSNPRAMLTTAAASAAAAFIIICQRRCGLTRIYGKYIE